MNRVPSFISVVLLGSSLVVGQVRVPSPNAETEVRQTLSNFIQDFDNLDWAKFRNAFAEDATVFYPREVPHRAIGRAEIEANFRHVFEQIRGQASKPPSLSTWTSSPESYTSRCWAMWRLLCFISTTARAF